MYKYVQMYIIYIYKFFELNDNKETRYEGKELRLFCKYKIFTLFMKWYSVLWKTTGISCKCIL